MFSDIFSISSGIFLQLFSVCLSMCSLQNKLKKKKNKKPRVFQFKKIPMNLNFCEHHLIQFPQIVILAQFKRIPRRKKNSNNNNKNFPVYYKWKTGRTKTKTKRNITRNIFIVIVDCIYKMYVHVDVYIYKEISKYITAWKCSCFMYL